MPSEHTDRAPRIFDVAAICLVARCATADGMLRRANQLNDRRKIGVCGIVGGRDQVAGEQPQQVIDANHSVRVGSPNRRLHRCPSNGPVPLHEHAFGSPARFQDRLWFAGNRFPPKRLAKASASSGLAKQSRSRFHRGAEST